MASTPWELVHKMTPKNSRTLILMAILGFHGLSSRQTFAQNDDRYNYRDQCRSIVAGSYWKIVDEYNSTQLFLKLNTDNLKKLDKEISKFNKELKSLEASQIKKTYDPERDNRLRVVRARIELLEKNKSQIKEKNPELLQKLEKFKLEREETKARMSQVFDIMEKPADTAGTVPKSIEYKTSCPKYRHVCPLPAKERKALLEIFKRDTVPTSCLKYSYIR